MRTLYDIDQARMKNTDQNQERERGSRLAQIVTWAKQASTTAIITTKLTRIAIYPSFE